ncbi:hypothetical protein BHE90_011084 [Fusarium euwallaceae]|uniref:Major facilitator superfamily (MFS) profile domain-containing protein n=1 Tax=Fusarium euwallaceae TaxID=1147111 RepID=A0A430LFI2_9HYPO|nr:hypothetical protein BHE90_011084 [Fusarium euwallaceae]
MHGNQHARATPDEETPLLLHEQGRSDSEHGITQQSTTQSPDEAKILPSVSWASMPSKGQLAVIMLVRLAEPISERSLTAYLFYQLQWFDKSLDASSIAKQAGHLTAAFAASQCATSLWWGRAADSPVLGRKGVLVIGLLGSAISALGMGFSTTYRSAMLFRMLAGALNGNVAVLRTMVSEVVLDKRYRSRAFLLLPMCFNVGNIVGPLMSGLLANPIDSLPGLFGPGSFFGGRDGVQWMSRFPYALPNVVCTLLLITSALGVIFALGETHPLLRHDQPGQPWLFGKGFLGSILKGRKDKPSYQPIPRDDDSEQIHETPNGDSESVSAGPTRFTSILSKNVCLTLLQHFLQALHVATFNSALIILLPSPRGDRSQIHLPFQFAGGLGLSTKKVAMATSTIGTIGIPLQLFLFPKLSVRLGLLRSYRIFLPLSIVVYCILPYLTLLPDDYVIVWACMTAVLSLHVVSRVFVTPATMMLVDGSSPSPALLGTIHGFASSISSAARILGPTVGGTVLGWGLANNLVGIPFWGMALIASVNFGLLLLVKDSDAS